jgi:diguanylate cyclase (GGDEF)-like protein/PAS domain S-box-containing protein
MALDDSGIDHFVQAHPRRFAKSCLRCHGKPADAPASLVEWYGRTAGFGRSVGDVTVELAAIPVSAAHTQAAGLSNRHAMLAGAACLMFLLGLGMLAYLYHTARHRAEKRLRQLSQAVDQMAASVVITDAQGTIEYVNPAFSQNSGYDLNEVIGQNPRVLKSGRMPAEIYNDMWRVLTAGQTWRGEMHNRRKDGSFFWELATIAPIKNEQGTITHYVAVKEEISRRKIIEQELMDAARSDALTDLANRTGFCDELARALQLVRDQPGRRCAIFFLDLDRFKIVNDSLGHDAGDLLLKQIAQRLSDAVHADLTPGPFAERCVLARFGGDEFLVLLDGMDGAEPVLRAAESTLASLGQPYDLNGHEVFSTASIGVRLIRHGDDDDVADLLRDADTAMYESKMAGRGRYTLFDNAMRQRVQRRLSLENDLRRAAGAGELFLLYQPIVNLQTGQVVSYEALIRWQHPEHGVISPGEFIPIAEETGLILEIGQWVLRTAATQLGEWQRTMGEDAPPNVSVNLSRSQLMHPGLAAHVQRILERTGLAAEQLQLEITESSIMHDVPRGVRVLGQLKALGVQLAMDDFGTGHSSLACLHDLPFDVLKIDRSFVMGIDRNREFTAMIQAVNALAANLDIQVIAEGIETLEHLALLQAMDCRLGQGYCFSHPMPPDEVPYFCVACLQRPGTQALA